MERLGKSGIYELGSSPLDEIALSKQLSLSRLIPHAVLTYCMARPHNDYV
jgi:hypothetical protein